jgi:drug/metabolite transporter (DMT)-like permease
LFHLKHGMSDVILRNPITAVWNNGLLSIAAAAFAFSVSSSLVRPISPDISVIELVFVRSFLSLGLSFLANADGRGRYSMTSDGAPPPLFGRRENWPLLLLRGMSGALAMNVFYASIQRLLLAEALALLFLNPAIVAVLAFAVLDERVVMKQIGGIAASLGGMLLVVRPPLQNDEAWTRSRTFGVGFGVMSAFLAAIAYISIRKIGKAESSLTIAVYFHATALVTSVVGLLGGIGGATVVVPSLNPDFLCMVGIAVASFCAQLLISRGFQLSRAAVAAAVNYLQVIFGAVWGYVFFGESISVVSVLGILLIFGGVLLISAGKTTDNGGDDREELLLLPTQSAVRVERQQPPPKMAQRLTDRVSELGINVKHST